ncbi:MAG TPA: polysaccharide deacetylase family protein [Actinomycetota bacterium]|nr:polysaccharide deacetylase family protein [Actinomycetota bacterium]
MAHVLHRSAPRRLKRMLRALALVAASLLLFGAAGTRPAITVAVNGRTITVFDRTPLGQAMRFAGVDVRDGVLYSAGEHRPLDRHYHEPGLFVDGAAARRSTPLRQGARVRAEDGPDAVESVEISKVVVPSGLPEVEHRLWNPGQNGIEEVTKGARSGEVLSRVTALPVVHAAAEAQPLVALTFDDGPDPRWTVPILENLQREGIQATFCVVGRQARKYPELITRIVAEGHVLCDHTETHPEGLKAMSSSEIDVEVGSPSFFLRTISGVQPAFFRAPGGSINDKVVRAAHLRGMRMLAWSVDPRDFRGGSPAEIQRRVMEEVKPGSVILLHDGGGIRSDTVAALPGLITQLRAAGYGFRTP